METPLISVLLPVYKHEAYLMDAVQSIINQTYKNWELFILCDDYSIDYSPYGKIDKRIDVRYGEDHQGKWYQMNRGFRFANGDYIAFQDADDISIPQRFELSLNNIGENDFLYAYGICLLPNGEKQYMEADPNHLTKKPLGCQGTYFIKNSKIVPKYEKDIGRGDDWIWVIKCIHAGMTMCGLPLPLYYYRDYTGNYRASSNKIKRYFSNRKLRKLVTQITQ